MYMYIKICNPHDNEFLSIKARVKKNKGGSVIPLGSIDTYKTMLRPKLRVLWPSMHIYFAAKSGICGGKTLLAQKQFYHF